MTCGWPAHPHVYDPEAKGEKKKLEPAMARVNKGALLFMYFLFDISLCLGKVVRIINSFF